MSATWRNPKHRQQWRNTLDTYVYPVIGDLPVQAVDVAHVMKILEPIWQTKPETASRVRGRIETVLDWATARGYRHGREPRALARPSRPAAAEEDQGAQGAAPAGDALRRRAGLHGRAAGAESISARALEFTILAAVTDQRDDRRHLG